MASFVPHLPIYVAAVLWPLAAGIAVVAWSKSRAAAHRRRLERLEAELKGMFRTLEAQPVPPRLDVILEALDEQAEMAKAVAAPNLRAPTP